jgi:ribonuclease E
MANRMLIDASHPEETRVVVTRGNRIEEFDFETADRRQLRGNIYLAKVTRVEPSLQACFVEFGGNRHGFLAFAEIHPDYYQIPLADREALLAEEAARARSADDEDEDGRSRRSRGKSRAKASRTDAATAEGEDAAASEENGEDEEDAVEQIGGGDALEELPQRSPQYRRQYKIQEVVKRRQILLVQVVKEERGNKGAALTTYLSLAGRYSVLMPNTARGGGISRKITNGVDRKRLKEVAGALDVPDGMGVILRTAGASRTKAEIKRDFEYLLRVWENVRELTLKSTAPALVYEEGSLIKRAIRDLYSKEIDEVMVAGEAGYREAKDFMKMLMPSQAKNVQHYRETQPLFASAGVEGQLEAMFSNVVNLKSGGYIVLNQTEALVAIDVNSGRSTREHNIEDTALKTNLEAAEEVARQLRLRDLAGLIVIDFIDMEEKRNNRTVERRLKDCLKNDRARIQLGRISHFGLMEMSRQRIRTSVLESTTIPCPHCGGTGHMRSTSSIALQAVRAIEEALLKDGTRTLTLRTRGDVALYVLNHKRAILGALEQRFGVSITVSIDEHVAGGHPYAIERGEVVSRGEQRPAEPIRTAVRMDDAGLPPDEDDVAIEDEDEETEAEEAAGESRAEDGRGEDENGRRRRRRRRRRGGRDRGDRPGENGTADAAAESRDEAAPSDDDEDDAADANGENGGEAVGDDADGRRRRRRRRRGGRRGRRDRDEPVTTAEAADAPVSAAEAATDLSADMPAADAADAVAESVAETGDAPKPRRGRTRKAKPEQAGDENADAAEGEAVPALAAEETPAPAPRRGRARKGAAESVAEPAETPLAPEAKAAASSPAAAPAIAEEAPAPTEERASRRRTAVIVEEEPEVEDPSAPKRTGWWSKAKSLLGG